MLYKAPDLLPYTFDKPSVFLAGGISNCPDWQTEISSMLDTVNFDIVNPRRGLEIDNNSDVAAQQIAWEFKALKKVQTCTFWFPKETLCPITLFELGKMLVLADQGKIRVIVGYHEEYKRAFDVNMQVRLMGLIESSVLLLNPGWNNYVDAMVANWGSEGNII